MAFSVRAALLFEPTDKDQLEVGRWDVNNENPLKVVFPSLALDISRWALSSSHGKEYGSQCDVGRRD